MSSSVTDILAPLDPHWDCIIRRPMSGREVKALEKEVGLAVPGPLKEYLLAVGLFQDLTAWGASSFEVYESPAEFVSARKFLCSILPPQKQGLFPFGDDGAGDVFCLPTDAEQPCRIHFVDHETAKISKKKEFTDWLQDVVKKVMRGIRRRVPNEHKVWAVQFSFRGASYEKLKELLSSLGKFREIDSKWLHFDKSPSKVTSSDRIVEFKGEQITLGRLECSDWDGPQLHFDMREHLGDGLEHSQIRALDRYFKANCPGYRLVDYGPLDSRKLD